jgi:hypothetical protein
MYPTDANAVHGDAVALDCEISFCVQEDCSYRENIQTKAVDRNGNTQILRSKTGWNV